MNNMFNNNLVSNYNSYNQNVNNQMKNNPLVPFISEKAFTDSRNPVQNPQQMNQMYQQMMQMKRMQQANIMAKMNEIERMRGKIKVNDDQLKNAIIKPIEVEKTDSRELLGKFREVSNKLESELKEHWAKRTNQPYKNILKNEDYTKNFRKKEDLIVHKVSSLDKLGLERAKHVFILSYAVENSNVNDSAILPLVKSIEENSRGDEFEFSFAFRQTRGEGRC